MAFKRSRISIHVMQLLSYTLLGYVALRVDENTVVLRGLGQSCIKEGPASGAVFVTRARNFGNEIRSLSQMDWLKTI